MTAGTMRNEGDDFFALSGNYTNFNSHSDAFKKFTATVTSFKQQVVNSYIEDDRNRRKKRSAIISLNSYFPNDCSSPVQFILTSF